MAERNKGETTTLSSVIRSGKKTVYFIAFFLMRRRPSKSRVYIFRRAAVLPAASDSAGSHRALYRHTISERVTALLSSRATYLFHWSLRRVFSIQRFHDSYSLSIVSTVRAMHRRRHCTRQV